MAYKVLLVYPEIPPTYWSMRYSLKFIGKRATLPPVGLLTVAAMLPADWSVTLVDMNVEKLRDHHIREADVVFISAMIVQKDSMEAVIRRCNLAGKTVVAGGPYPSGAWESIEGVDYFVLGEAEDILPEFLRDFEAGTARHIYREECPPDITRTPAPRFDLLRKGRYASMALQYSRGCPHSCEFCEIPFLFGHNPRTKTADQFVREMELVYQTGFRGSLFVVDDNFIGNRTQVKQLLPRIEAWQREHDYPFALFTEATVTLASDPDLMKSMVDAGFNMVFLGIETPDADSLRCAHKGHNLRNDLLESVHTIQRSGMEVSSGFIVGFDSDTPDIFDRQITFIQKSGIATAMVGLLMAVPNTPLHARLQAEGRLLAEGTGNNTHDLRLNFMPRMDKDILVAGYRRVLSEIYSPARYFERCLDLLKNLKPHRTSSRRIRWTELRAFSLSLLIQTFSGYGHQYLRYLVRAFFLKPGMLAESVTMAVKGHHFFRMTQRLLAADRFQGYVDNLAATLRERAAEFQALAHNLQERASELQVPDLETKVAEFRAFRDRFLEDAHREYNRLHRDTRAQVAEALDRLEAAAEEFLAALSSLETMANQA